MSRHPPENVRFWLGTIDVWRRSGQKVRTGSAPPVASPGPTSTGGAESRNRPPGPDSLSGGVGRIGRECPGGNRLVLLSPGGSGLRVVAYDVSESGLSGGRPLSVEPFRDGTNVANVVFSPDGDRVLVEAGSVPVLFSWKDGSAVPLAGKPILLTEFQFSEDGRRVAAAIQDAHTRGKPKVELKVWETALGQEVLSLSLPSGQVRFQFRGGTIAAVVGEAVHLFDGTPK